MARLAIEQKLDGFSFHLLFLLAFDVVKRVHIISPISHIQWRRPDTGNYLSFINLIIQINDFQQRRRRRHEEDFLVRLRSGIITKKIEDRRNWFSD